MSQESQLSHAFFTQSKMDAWIDNDYRKMSTFLGKCKHFQEDVKSFRKNNQKLSTNFRKSQCHNDSIVLVEISDFYLWN